MHDSAINQCNVNIWWLMQKQYYLQWGWWIFQWAGRRLGWCSRRAKGWRWRGRQWCWCRRTSLAISASLHSHTRGDSACWGRSRRTQGPTGGPGATDLKGLLGLIPWRPLSSVRSRLISTLYSASWSLSICPQWLNHKSILSAWKVNMIQVSVE